MGGGREGLQVTAGATINLVIALAILAAILMVIRVEFLGILADAIVDGLARSDAIRMYSAVSNTASLGSASVALTLDNTYETIEIEGREANLSKADGQHITFLLPRGYDYENVELEGNRVCMRKDGTRVTFTTGGCTVPTCGENACSAVTRRADGTTVPTRGYQCVNGVYTDDGFFTHYYRSSHPTCGDADDRFVQMNRFHCPETVQGEKEAACVAVASWRCDGSDGQVTITVDGDSMNEDLTCDGTVHHDRFSKTFAIDLADRQRREDVSATAEVRIGEGSMSETVDFRAVSYEVLTPWQD